MPSTLAPHVTAFNVWWVAGALSIAWFTLGVQQPALPARGAAAILGALLCLASMVALTVMARQAWSPESLVGAVAIYTVGITLSLSFGLFYAFFFMFWHAKNF